MLCSKCGFDLQDDQVTFCPECGELLDQEAYFRQVEENVLVKQQIKNYLPLSIFSAVFTCVPLGLVAVFYSWRVDKLIATGKYREAQNASVSARLWAGMAIVAGVAAAATAISLYVSGMVWLADNI